MADGVLGVAVVGLGWWGRQTARCLARAGGRFRVVRGVDLDPTGAREIADEIGFELGDDIGAALDDARIDVVVLTTPHAIHEAQVLRAAAAGKHVFCEKPLALNAASAARCIDACADAGVVLGVGHERRFEPAMVEVARLVRDGSLGTIMHVESDSSHAKLAGLDPADWRATRANGPSVPMTGMGVHLTDAYLDMFGPIETLHALRARRVTAIETGDVVSVQVGFSSGMTGSFSAIMVTPFFMRFHVFGSEGWAEVRDSAHPDDPGAVATLTLCDRSGKLTRREFPAIDTVTANYGTFADAIQHGVPYPFSREQILGNVAVLEAISRSLDNGEAVRPGGLAT